jgi:simple sugar transport system permease protein
VVWFWLAGLVAIFGILNPFFFWTSNLQNIPVQATVLGLLRLAQSLVLLVGEIDLSIAAVTGISSALGALAIQRLGLPWAPAFSSASRSPR